MGSRPWWLALVLAVVAVSAEPMLLPSPFVMRVVDARTGAGVGGVRVVADNGVTRDTLPNGDVWIGDRSLFNRRVRFEIRDERGRFGPTTTELAVGRGRHAQIAVILVGD